jgi:hypothetical protein
MRLSSSNVRFSPQHQTSISALLMFVECQAHFVGLLWQKNLPILEWFRQCMLARFRRSHGKALFHEGSKQFCNKSLPVFLPVIF